ncbi:hypothetical protein DSM109990_03883 (plasmid) [Sulfitobacter dubius]|uniref:Mutator family transposase n=1 Tax=Sulfitobacter dubius TaxID=218673 RepID=A0ABY3ZR87_9RHOB|nr:hypothetical protein DSM109990_03883 [Sulfitobacter dubius]
MRNALACVGKKDKPIVTAALRTAFDQDTITASKEHWAKLLDAFEPRHAKLGELMRRAEDDVLAYKSFPREHWSRFTAPTRLNASTKSSSGGPTSSGSFPMKPQSHDWSEH